MLKIQSSAFVKHGPSGGVASMWSQRNLIGDNRTLARVCQFSSILFLLFTLVHPTNASSETVSLNGRWLLNAEASTDTADELKGIRKSQKKKRRDSAKAKSSGPTSATQERYWQQANEGKEWKRSRELAHAGPIQRLLESANLEIIPREGGGYFFIYADGYERPVVPNLGGRVFTASGEELVKSEIGFTLAYTTEQVLNLETRINKGGQLHEQISLSADGNTLTIHIEIDRRDWKWIAKVKRVYSRVPQ